MMNDENNFVLTLIGYNRVEFLARRLEEIFLLSPPFVYVSIDYSNPKLVKEFGELLEEYSSRWPSRSKLTYFIHEENLGLVKHISTTISKQLSTYEHVIVIEDDIAISKPFYNACKIYMRSAHLNEKYASFSGFSILQPINFLEKFNRFRSSPYFLCWGWVVSRDNWRGFEVDLSKIDIAESLQDSMQWRKLSSEQQNTWIGRFEKVKLDQLRTWDIQFQFHSFKIDKPHLLPMFRLVENEGFSDNRSTHTISKRPRVLGSYGLSKRELNPILKGKLIENLLTLIDSNLFIEDRKKILKFWTSINFQIRKWRN